MTLSEFIKQEKNEFSDLRLEPAKLDFLSVKTQLVIAAILSSLLVFTIYWPTLKLGFLLDDFLHLDYVARAVQKGDWHDLLANLYSNWGGSDIMRSYRPLTSISLFVDYLIYHSHAAGYHFTNLLLYCACCLFIALIASELTGPFGNRMRVATAIWSAILFAAYPLHVESVAWVIGRVDVLCTLFYLAALYYFLRLRLIEEPPYLWICLICFALSLFSKEMGVTLPAVATVFSLLIAPRSQSHTMGTRENFLYRIFRRPSAIELKALGLLWLTLAVFALLRFMILGEAVGGYKHASLSSFLNFIADRSSLWKLIAPANEEIIPKTIMLQMAGSVPYIAATAFIALRCLVSPSLIRYFCAFFLFGVISLLPTFQVWSIAPNLCGSRLFFLSSSALCLGLAFAFMPNEDWIDRKTTKFVASAGTAFLIYTLVFFCVLVRTNLTPFIKASALMNGLTKQITALAANNNKKFLVLNLPTDYQGAPMITRPFYFKTMLSDPFIGGNIGARIVTAEMDLPSSHSLYTEEKLQAGLSALGGGTPLIWSEPDGKLELWRKPTGTNGFQCQFDNLNGLILEPSNIRTTDAKTWHLFDNRHPQVQILDHGLRLDPGRQGLKAELPIAPANPLKTPLVRIKMKIFSNLPAEQVLPMIQFQWHQKTKVLSFGKLARLVQTGKDQYECNLSKSKEWLLGGDISAIGLALQAGPYYADLQSIEGISSQEGSPESNR